MAQLIVLEQLAVSPRVAVEALLFCTVKVSTTAVCAERFAGVVTLGVTYTGGRATATANVAVTPSPLTVTAPPLGPPRPVEYVTETATLSPAGIVKLFGETLQDVTAPVTLQPKKAERLELELF